MALKDIKGREITVPVYVPTSQGEIDLQSAGSDIAEDPRVGELTDLLTTDKDSIVEALNELFTSASDGKLAVKSAIAGKVWGAGLPADPTFTDLANKILAVVDRVANEPSIASTVSGPNLLITPPAGYYNGTTSTVRRSDPDFIAGNIKAGVDLFGLVGTLAEGKKFALMSFPSNVLNGANWMGNGNSDLRQFNVAVTGLSFRPNTLVIKQTGQYGAVTVYGMARYIDSFRCGVGASYNPNGGASGAIATTHDGEFFTADGMAINRSFVVSNTVGIAGNLLFTE